MLGMLIFQISKMETLFSTKMKQIDYNLLMSKLIESISILHSHHRDNITFLEQLRNDLIVILVAYKEEGLLS